MCEGRSGCVRESQDVKGKVGMCKGGSGCVREGRDV